MIVPNAIPEAREHDRNFDRLAVLVARIEVEGVRQCAEPEDAISGLDVVQAAAGPPARPLAEDPVTGALVGVVIRQIALREIRVQPFVERHLHELVEDLEIVLAVGVDGEDQICRMEVAVLEPRAQLCQCQCVGLRHALVDVVAQQRATVSIGHQAFDRGARAIGRAVIDDDELVDHRVELVEDVNDRRLLVECGDDRDASRFEWCGHGADVSA